MTRSDNLSRRGDRQLLDEIAWINSKPRSDLDDVVQRDVASPALDLAEIRPVQADHLSGLLLTEPQFMTPRHHTPTELLSGG